MSPHALRRAYFERNLPHLQSGAATLFVTMSTEKRFVLTPPARDVVLQAIRAVHEHAAFFVAAVIMPDHVHLMFSPAECDRGEYFGLAEIMSAIRGPSAHAVNKLLGRKGSVWQREYFDRVLRSGEFLGCLEYICSNPVRKGLVKCEDEYPWIWVNPLWG